jgi:hypothetical protein
MIRHVLLSALVVLGFAGHLPASPPDLGYQPPAKPKPAPHGKAPEPRKAFVAPSIPEPAVLTISELPPEPVPERQPQAEVSGLVAAFLEPAAAPPFAHRAAVPAKHGLFGKRKAQEAKR